MAISSMDWAGLAVADGRYRIAERIGVGGVGAVYRAEDRRLGAEVVLKVPRMAMLEEAGFADRFAREIRSLVRLAHPHVVRITDVGEHDGVPFAVMQHLPGGSLEDRRPKDA